MPALRKFENKMNKQLGIRILTAHPEVKPKEFWRDLRKLFEDIANVLDVEEFLNAHQKAAELLEVLPA